MKRLIHTLTDTTEHCAIATPLPIAA